MKVALQSVLLIVIGVMGLGWYFLSLFVIGLNWSTSPDSAAFRDFMSLSITTIGVTLATFVGMLLGFRGVAEQINRGVEESKPAAPNDRLQRIIAGTAGSLLQWIAAGLYVFSLLLALFFWWNGGSKTDPAVVNLGKSFLGLIGGAMSVLFNTPKTN